MSIFDKLMETDAAKLQEKEKKEVEVSRLTELLGAPFILTCSTLTREQIKHVSEVSGEDDDKVAAILEGCRLEGRKLSDKVLLDKFGVVSGKEVVEKLFRSGEISAIYQNLSALSGYTVDAVKTVEDLKN